MAQKTLLLTGSGGTPTQNVVNSLRHEKSDYRIIGADCDPFNVFLTKGYDRKYRVPRSDDSSYVQVLNEIIAKEGIDFLHAQPDVEVGVISANRDHIDAPVCLPSKEEVALCHDKYELIIALRKAGVPCAQSFLINNEADLDEAFNTLKSKVWLRLIRGAGGRGSLPVEDIVLAKRWIDYWEGWGRFSAEEFLPGRNLAWQCAYKDGSLIGSIAWERIRYIIRHVSPSGITGTPSVARFINDDDVHKIGNEAVKAIAETPNGVYGVDMRANSDGVPCVTEINPGRFFTPSYMYAQAGYNLVRKFFDVALDQKSESPLETRAVIPENTYWIRGIDVNPVLIRIDEEPVIGSRVSKQ